MIGDLRLGKQPNIVGFNIAPYDIPEQDILEIVARSGSHTHTVLDSAGLACKVYDEAVKADLTHAPIIVFRPSADSDADWNHPRYADMDKFVRDNKALFGGRPIRLQFLNEPNVKRDAEQDSIAALRGALAAGIRFMLACERNDCLGSVFGIADASMLEQRWIDAGHFDSFLKTASRLSYAEKRQDGTTRRPLIVVNHHMYAWGDVSRNGGGASEWDMADASLMTIARRPSKADLTTRPKANSNWLTFRFMWLYFRCDDMNIERYIGMIGEGIHDDTRNSNSAWIPAAEKKFAGGQKLRGPLDQRRLWEGWGHNPEAEILSQLEFIIDRLPETIIAITLFAINETSQWPTFNFRRWAAFWPAWYTRTAQWIKAFDMTSPTTPPPVPPATFPPPLPSRLDIGWGDARQTAPGAINLRGQPDANADNVIASLMGGDLLRVHKTVKYETPDGVWRPVLRSSPAGERMGWARTPPAYYAPVLGMPTKALGGAHVTQLGSGVSNACGQASVVRAVLYKRALLGDTTPLTVQDVTAIIKAKNPTWSPGLFTTTTQLVQALAALGITAMPHVNVTLATIRDAVLSGQMVIGLFERSKLPGALGYYNYGRAHFSPITGASATWFEVSDTLSKADGYGAPLQVTDADMLEAMKSSTYLKDDGSVGFNFGFQAIICEPVNVPPPTRPARVIIAEMKTLLAELELLIL